MRFEEGYGFAVMRFVASGDPAGEARELRKAARSLILQPFDPSLSRGSLHVQLLLGQTVRAMRTGQLLARKAEVDFLMRLALTDQIQKAISLAGAKPHGEAMLLLYGKVEDLAHDEGVLAEMGFRRAEGWGTGPERESFALAERAALLGIGKGVTGPSVA
ncbi:MAG: hypothetical protein JRN39_04660 [Nitrososphaerota archaeon]|nr:hypothetical protein [Nitrososphaerota archaeon]MDG6939677.1 hypothetical protein [Nitrososphaerota archaeon]